MRPGYAARLGERGLQLMHRPLGAAQPRFDGGCLLLELPDRHCSLSAAGTLLLHALVELLAVLNFAPQLLVDQLQLRTQLSRAPLRDRDAARKRLARLVANGRRQRGAVRRLLCGHVGFQLTQPLTQRLDGTGAD